MLTAVIIRLDDVAHHWKATALKTSTRRFTLLYRICSPLCWLRCQVDPPGLVRRA